MNCMQVAGVHISLAGPRSRSSDWCAWPHATPRTFRCASTTSRNPAASTRPSESRPAASIGTGGWCRKTRTCDRRSSSSSTASERRAWVPSRPSPAPETSADGVEHHDCPGADLACSADLERRPYEPAVHFGRHIVISRDEQHRRTDVFQQQFERAVRVGLIVDDVPRHCDQVRRQMTTSGMLEACPQARQRAGTPQRALRVAEQVGVGKLETFARSASRSA